MVTWELSPYTGQENMNTKIDNWLETKMGISEKYEGKRPIQSDNIGGRSRGNMTIADAQQWRVSKK